MTVRIFGITRSGLVALSLAVATLWTCVGLEKATRLQADRDTVISIRTLARLRRLTPASDITPAREPGSERTAHRPSIS